MLTSVHYFTRQASRERRLAREALTDAARERHSALAAHFASLAKHDETPARKAPSMVVGRK